MLRCQHPVPPAGQVLPHRARSLRRLCQTRSWPDSLPYTQRSCPVPGRPVLRHPGLRLPARRLRAPAARACLVRDGDPDPDGAHPGHHGLSDRSLDRPAGPQDTGPVATGEVSCAGLRCGHYHLIPQAVKTASNAAVNLESRSRIRWVDPCPASARLALRSRASWVAQAAVEKR